MTITAPEVPPLATVRGVELVQAGTWHLSNGTFTFTAGDLAAAVGALDCPAIRRPVLKLGHTDPRFDGQPAVGWVDNMTVGEDGTTVVGDYVGMPGWLGPVLASAYPDRSIEGCYDLVCQIGHTHPFVITAVALLGVTEPGVGTLTSLQDVAALYGVAAAAPVTGVPVAVTVHASKESRMPNPRPPQVAAGVTSEDVRREYYEQADANGQYSRWITEIQLDPMQLIVMDDTHGQLYRVPILIKGDDADFGEPVPVRIEYVDDQDEIDEQNAGSGTKTAASASKRIVFASRAESRPGSPPGGPQPTSTPAPQAGVSHAVTSALNKPLALQLDGRAFDNALGRSSVSASTTPTGPVGEPAQEGAGMPATIREALGLAADASDEQVRAAFDAQLAKKDPPPDPVPAEPQPDADTTTEQPNPAPEQPAVQPEGQLVAASAVPEEFRAQLERTSRELADFKAARAAEDRRHLFDGAVQAGKITPADRGAWEKRYDKAPEVTAEILASMAPGSAVPLAAVGSPGAEEPDEFDTQFAHLFPPRSTQEA